MDEFQEKRARKLILRINSDLNCRNKYTEIFALGAYQIQFRYREIREKVERYYELKHYYTQERIEPRILQKVWIGEVVTPLVELRLVLPQTEVAVQ